MRRYVVQGDFSRAVAEWQFIQSQRGKEPGVEAFKKVRPDIELDRTSPLYAQACEYLNLLELGVSIPIEFFSPRIRQALILVAATRQRLTAQSAQEQRRLEAQLAAQKNGKTGRQSFG